MGISLENGYIVYGASGTGSVAVEAALTLIGAPFRVVEAPPLGDRAKGETLARINPMRQVPALLAAPDNLITESAAILIWLCEVHPEANLAPMVGSAGRAAFLQWMAFVSSAIYALYWVRDDPSRVAHSEEAQTLVKTRTAERISQCWGVMESRLEPGEYLLGDTLSVLDLYVAVVSRWGPRRRGLRAAAPRMADCMRRVDGDARLADLWLRRFERPAED